MEEVLTAFGNHYSAVSNGLEGLSLLKTESFDIVITNVILSLMDGNEFIGEISKMINPPAIIVLTGVISEIIPNPVISEIIQKPVTLDIL